MGGRWSPLPLAAGCFARSLPAPVGVLARFAAAIVVVAAALPVHAARADISCIECHRDQRSSQLRTPTIALSPSAHGRHNVDCTGCHGGRPDERTVRAHDPSAGFRPRPIPEAVPELCGHCHADAERMAESELPTDQESLFEASAHGRALAAGNWRAPTCISCHTAHSVRPVSDPDAPVHPDHVVDVCTDCHSSETVMEGTELPTDQGRKWERSVHGRAWALAVENGAYDDPAEGEILPPTCAGCHDAHGAQEGSQAIARCGVCHEAIREAFDSGPHAEAFRLRGFIDCAECHGSHDIRRADSSLIGIGRENACRRCHAADQEMYERIERMGRALARAEGAERRAEASETLGDAARERLIALRTQTRLAVHALDTDEVERLANELYDAAGEPEPSADAPSTEPEPWWSSLVLPASIAIGVAVALLLGLLGAWLRWRRAR